MFNVCINGNVNVKDIRQDNNISVPTTDLTCFLIYDYDDSRRIPSCNENK